MASINGDWFHSRSSSNIDELLKVRSFVNESCKRIYFGVPWSGGREANQILYDFAAVGGIKPSTMQTKIRAMIRYGFVKDGNTFPLEWTRFGKLWNDLFSVGNFTAANQIYSLTLTISLAIYAFNNSPSHYSTNPAMGEMPLKHLLNILDGHNAISIPALEELIDGHTTYVGHNYSYWKTDLLNSGLFIISDNNFVYSGRYPELMNEIKHFQPNLLLSDEDWNAIRENPLIEISPFKNSINGIFEGILLEQNIEEQSFESIITAPIVDLISEQEEIEIPQLDILTDNNRYNTYSRRVRNAIWAKRIKQVYENKCVVPNCDVEGKIFVAGAHIKPDNIEDDGIPHRAHMLNGICLCGNCHIAFDRGYFSLSDDGRIITSSMFDAIVDQNLKSVILSSSGISLKNRIDNRLPLVDFIRYHRTNIFKY